MEINFVFSGVAFATGLFMSIVSGLFFFFLPQCNPRKSGAIASIGVYGSVAVFGIAAIMIISRGYSVTSFSIGALGGTVLMLLAWTLMGLGILFLRKKGRRSLDFETVKGNETRKEIKVVILDFPGYLLYGVIYILIAITTVVAFSANSVSYKHNGKKIMTYVCDYSLIPESAYVDLKEHDGVYRKELNGDATTEIRQILVDKYDFTEKDNEWASGGLDMRDYGKVLNIVQEIVRNDSIPFVKVK